MPSSPPLTAPPATLPGLIEQAVQRLIDDPSAAPTWGEIAAVARTTDTTDRPLGIAEVAERTGVTPHTLRYYERIGLVSTPRQANGRRCYDTPALARIVFITRLRSSGLGISELRRYLELVDDPDPRAQVACAEILRTHRTELARRIAELQLALTITDFKLAHLDDPDTHPIGGAAHRAQ